MNDEAATGRVLRRWNRALRCYAQGVAWELDILGVQVLDWFVHVSEAPFWIDLAVVDREGRLVEFYFSDDMGWILPEGTRCGRLTPPEVAGVRERAAQVAPPPYKVAPEILRALAGQGWAADPSPDVRARHVDPQYLTALLSVLEGRRP
jgi:hypothetical protein